MAKPKGDKVPAALNIDPAELESMPPWKRELLFKREKVPVSFFNEFNPDEEDAKNVCGQVPIEHGDSSWWDGWMCLQTFSYSSSEIHHRLQLDIHKPCPNKRTLIIQLCFRLFTVTFKVSVLPQALPACSLMCCAIKASKQILPAVCRRGWRRMGSVYLVKLIRGLSQGLDKIALTFKSDLYWIKWFILLSSWVNSPPVTY